MLLRHLTIASLLALSLALPALAPATPAAAQPTVTPQSGPAPWPDLADWPSVATAARDKTVRLGIAGATQGQQQYLEWAAGELERLSAITLDIVDYPSEAALLDTLATEGESGVDLAALGSRAVAQAGHMRLLPERFAYRLPNWHFVDRAGMPSIMIVAGLPTHYSAVPWGQRSMTLYVNGAATQARPSSPAALLAYAQENPGRFTFPAPSTPAGAIFLEDVFLALATDPSALNRPLAESDPDAVAAPFFTWLDTMRPLLWQGGSVLPQSEAEARDLLARGDVDMIADANPLAGAAARAGNRWPETIAGFGFANGAVTDTHFLAVAPRAVSPEAALVAADFLLSPVAQMRKADVSPWGDPPVLSPSRLPRPEGQALREAMGQSAHAPGTLRIPRPHVSWIDWLDTALPDRLGRP